MPRPSRAILLAVLAASLGGCAPAPESDTPLPATSAAASDESAAPRAEAAPANADLVALAPATTSATAAGRWFLQESHPPRAVWGVPASEGMLTFSCDRADAQLVLERQAVGVAEDVRLLSIDADGTRMDYPAEHVDRALAPVLVTPIALDAPILDRMLIAQRLVVTAGDDAITTLAPGPSLRAVVDACRADLPG